MSSATRRSRMDAIVEFVTPAALQQCDITPPPSKSVLNRLAVIHALCGKAESLRPYASSSKDAKVIVDALACGGDHCDVGESGTAMRFLLSYLSYVGKPVTVTGSTRLCERPVAQLLDALGSLGAEFEFLGREGFLPVHIIKGISRRGGVVDFSGGAVSSQFISSLMLVAPMLDDGLRIVLPATKLSFPYVEMTAEVMRRHGINVAVREDEVAIGHGTYTLPHRCEVEGDWSAAAFWYEFASISARQSIRLHGLRRESLQGDAAAMTLFARLGVTTSWEDSACVISRGNAGERHLDVMMGDVPDIVIPFVVSCLLSDVTFKIGGIRHLRIKESDRIGAIVANAAALGYRVEWDDCTGQLSWSGERLTRIDAVPAIDSFGDHRVAMAFALAAVNGKVKVKGIECVGKSYPRFLSDISTAGFKVTGIWKEYCD